mgnify:CR=1 FL=1
MFFKKIRNNKDISSYLKLKHVFLLAAMFAVMYSQNSYSYIYTPVEMLIPIAWLITIKKRSKRALLLKNTI